MLQTLLCAWQLLILLITVIQYSSHCTVHALCKGGLSFNIAHRSRSWRWRWRAWSLLTQ